MYPKVSIIILNWNGWRDTIECLESVYRIKYSNYDVIVVDNGSTDDSVEKIKGYCEGKIKVKSKFFEYTPNNKPIYILEYTRDEAEKGGNFKKEKYFSKLPSNRKLRFILNSENLGFAEGNNVAIRYALRTLNSKYVLLLNNDTVVNSDFLTELVKIAENNKKIGIVGSLVRFYHDKDIIQSNGIKVNLKLGQIRHLKEKSVVSNLDCVMGCSMLISRDVLLNVGLFDSTFFAYVEEIDLCLRAKKKGYIIKTSPRSVIYHKHRGSTGNKIGYFVLYYRTRNYILMSYKLFNNVWIIPMTAYLVNILFESIFWSIKLKEFSLFGAVIKGTLDALSVKIKQKFKD